MVLAILQYFSQLWAIANRKHEVHVQYYKATESYEL